MNIDNMSQWICPVCGNINTVDDIEMSEEFEMHCYNCGNDSYTNELVFSKIN